MSSGSQRIVVIDHNVIDQINRGNAAAANALRALRRCLKTSARFLGHDVNPLSRPACVV
jgi:hypothetical protein